MPVVNIKILGGEVAPTKEQKVEVIKGVTDLFVRVMGKDPAVVVVLIEEVPPENWGAAGRPRSETLKKN